MDMTRQIEVRRHSVRLTNNDRRVITRLFAFADQARLVRVIERVEALADDEVDATLHHVLRNFDRRHEDLDERLLENFQQVCDLSGWKGPVSRQKSLLLGSYFTMEYSLESAALFNPSIVPHPDQSGIEPDALRFILSLRATGEGHVSSVVFRTGTILSGANIKTDPPAPFTSAVQLAPDQYYVKKLFRRKLADMAADTATVARLVDPLPERFTLIDLQRVVAALRASEPHPEQFAETIESALWLARSNYQLQLEDDADLSEIVIFPYAENEARGIEDLRLVRFTDEDGQVSYFGSYTAYNGFRILPMLLETQDFRTIHCHTLNGACARNKGLALFPRKINGHYAMCSRIDGQNLFIMYSDMVHFWETATLLAAPRYPWELMLIGNCGSPIETDEGWLLITHGVGPMRRYCLGAMLLDLDDPTRIIGRLREPLITPLDDEREGYVPNVVYSCGSLVHQGRLYIPFAMADKATGMASVEVRELTELLLNSPPE